LSSLTLFSTVAMVSNLFCYGQLLERMIQLSRTIYIEMLCWVTFSAGHIPLLGLSLSPTSPSGTAGGCVGGVAVTFLKRLAPVKATKDMVVPSGMYSAKGRVKDQRGWPIKSGSIIAYCAPSQEDINDWNSVAELRINSALPLIITQVLLSWSVGIELMMRS
jgi:hypothetical protein